MTKREMVVAMTSRMGKKQVMAQGPPNPPLPLLWKDRKMSSWPFSDTPGLTIAVGTSRRYVRGPWT